MFEQTFKNIDGMLHFTKTFVAVVNGMITIIAMGDAIIARGVTASQRDYALSGLWC